MSQWIGGMSSCLFEPVKRWAAAFWTRLIWTDIHCITVVESRGDKSMNNFFQVFKREARLYCGNHTRLEKPKLLRAVKSHQTAGLVMLAVDCCRLTWQANRPKCLWTTSRYPIGEPMFLSQVLYLLSTSSFKNCSFSTSALASFFNFFQRFNKKTKNI